MRIRVLVIDDHPLVSDGLRQALGHEPDLEVVGVVGTVEAAWVRLHVGDIDVAIVDVRLPDGSGLELIRRAQTLPGRPAFLVLSSFPVPQYVDAARTLGASGFLVKTAPTDEIVAAVHRVASGGTAFDGPRQRPVEHRWQPLSGRERDVVVGVLRGRTNDEIGADLGISRKTVEAHLSRLYQRFGVIGRTELSVRAEREGWLDMPSGGRADRRASRG